MAICNQLNVRFNLQEIDNTFDFYLINTTGKYIPFGAKCLDFETGEVLGQVSKDKELINKLPKGY